MKYGITTSIKLLPKLREQLEEEARKQSILASTTDHEENKPWDENTDTSEWI